MDLLKTDKTYASRANAVRALTQAADKLGGSLSDLRYVIAVNEDGRYAPVVMVHSQMQLLAFAHIGITVVA